MNNLYLRPIDYKTACNFIKSYHRHHLPPQGWKFGVGVNNGDQLVGVVTVGRPVARMLDDGWTLEITRLCTDGTNNVCTMLYGAAWRATSAMGYKRLVTYTLKSESGLSLKAAGYKSLYETKGGSWNCKSRPRTDKAPITQKLLWERKIND